MRSIWDSRQPTFDRPSNVKYRIEQLVQAALATLPADILPADIVRPVVDIERTRDAAHGDFATNVALQLAKPARRNPRQLAQAILDALPSSELIEQGGDRRARLHQLPSLGAGVPAGAVAHLRARRRPTGTASAAPAQSTVVEFVSANPTGPLHVGHGRQAALGDALASLLQSQGYQVSREFYYNDAGVQIQNLALSVQARARGIKPGEPGWPEAAYNGEYIQDIANDFLAKKTVNAFDGEAVKASGKVDDLDAVRRFAVAYLRHEQDLDLQKFGVRFDVYYLESSLYTDSKVDATVNALVAQRQDLRERRRAVAAHDRVRRRQRPRDAQVRRHVHVLRAGRRLSRHQVAARLSRRDQRAGHRSSRHDRARARRPAGA